MLRLLSLLMLFVTSPLQAKTYKVYFLGGQSNMEGFGRNVELPFNYRRPLKSLPIFHGNPAEDFSLAGGLGVWSSLREGSGVNFRSDGIHNIYSGFFGPELSFGHEMATLQPHNNIAIIKYAFGGSALAYGVGNNWYPDYRRGNGINQYDHFLTTIRNAFAAQDIDGDGNPDTLLPAGILWMQGESDAADSEVSAHRYLHNLTRIINLFRAAFRDADLPVVLGKITDSKMDPEDGLRMNWGSIVQQAQVDFVEQDTCATLLTITERFTHLNDGWHYHSSDYINLGKAFAESITSLENNCSAPD